MAEGRYDFRKAKDALCLDPLGVLRRLGCHERSAGAYWFITTPAHPDASTFWVAKHDGSWRHEGKGTGGDIIDLVVYVSRCSKGEAIRWAYAYLGWEAGPAGAARGLSDAELIELDRKAREREAAAQARREARGERMAGVWAALPTAAGTVVETYLREARKCPIERWSHFPGCLKYEARAEHVDEATGEVTEWPAMVALMARDGVAGGRAIHRTFLLPDGSGKAPVDPAKKMYGPKKGCSIRLSRGAGDLSPSQARSKGVRMPLLIGEGIETVSSVGPFLPECRTWAAGDLGNMAAIAWPDYASEVVLLMDNNTQPPGTEAWHQVEAALNKAVQHWMDQGKALGRKVIVDHSDVGSDYNDELRA